MARSKSSAQWLKEHFDDEYVRKSQKDGYRSRASYKLIEINERDQLFSSGMTVIDLGAAPGGWSQVAAQCVGDHGRVIASDILLMDQLAGVDFIQGDFTDDDVLDSILKKMDGSKADLVISDMAPNISGVASADQASAMYLVELALDLAVQVLKPNGRFLAKVFQGEGFEAYNMSLKSHFSKVVSRKPKASRPRSREIYQLASGFKP